MTGQSIGQRYAQDQNRRPTFRQTRLRARYHSSRNPPGGQRRYGQRQQADCPNNRGPPGLRFRSSTTTHPPQQQMPEGIPPWGQPTGVQESRRDRTPPSRTETIQRPQHALPHRRRATVCRRATRQTSLQPTALPQPNATGARPQSLSAASIDTTMSSMGCNPTSPPFKNDATPTSVSTGIAWRIAAVRAASDATTTATPIPATKGKK